MLPNIDPPLRVGEVPSAGQGGAIQPTYSYHDVARMMKVSEVTVKRWVKQGQIPSPTYYGSTARFSQQQMEQIAKGPATPETHERNPSPRAARASKAYHAKKPTAKKSAGVRDTKKKKLDQKPKGAWGNGLRKGKK